MDRDPLLLGLAAVFAGIAVLMTVLAFTSSLFLLVVALPFGVVSYIVWEHATGRLARRMRGSAADRGDPFGPGGATRAGQSGPFAGAGTGPRASQSRFGREARQRARANRRGAGRTRYARGGTAGSRTVTTGMTPAEASRELDVPRDASQADVKRAYREKVKETHPDSGGDEEDFKRVNRAYDVLRE